MKLSSRLAAMILLAPLAACATAPVETALVDPAAQIAAEPAEPPLEPHPDTSLVGLYLAGNAALRAGHAEQAAAYFAAAAELVEEEGQPFLRERAFVAAVNSGDIARAAQLAPAEGGQQRLGKLVLAVDAISRGDGAAANAILRTEDIGQPYRAVALMLRPWGAIMAGETEIGPLPRPGGRGDRLNSAFALANHALAYEHVGRFEDAEAAWKGLSETGVSFRGFDLAHAAFLERQGRKAEAIAIYDRMLAANPDDRAAATEKARASRRRAEPPALPTVQEAAAQALIMAATGALQQGVSENALIYVQLSLALDGDRPDSLILAGGFAEQRGEMEEARRLYARVPPAAPEFIESRLRIAFTYRQEDDLENALAMARQTAELAPKDLGAQVDYADILRASGQYEESAKVLTKLINAREREPDWRLLYARAIAYENAGRWPDAEKDLLTALEINPNQAEILNYLGFTWADRNERLPEALDLLQRAVRAQPNSGAIVDSLGWAYFRIGDVKKAVELLERAVELAPSDPEINDHLGDAYAVTEGRRLEALFQWERVLTLQPDDELRAAVQAKIAAEQQATNVAAGSLAIRP